MIPPRLVALLALSLAASSLYAQDAVRTVQMRVDGLVCAFCAQGIRKNLAAQPAVEDVVVDLERGVVAVALREGGHIDDQTLRDSLTQAGFSLRSLERSGEPLAALRARLEASGP